MKMTNREIYLYLIEHLLKNAKEQVQMLGSFPAKAIDISYYKESYCLGLQLVPFVQDMRNGIRTLPENELVDLLNKMIEESKTSLPDFESL